MYRDDHAAAIERADALQRELTQTQHRLAESEAARGELADRLRETRPDLDEPPPRRHTRIAIGLVGAIIAIGAAAHLVGGGREARAPSVPAVAPQPEPPERTTIDSQPQGAAIYAYAASGWRAVGVTPYQGSADNWESIVLVEDGYRPVSQPWDVTSPNLTFVLEPGRSP
jgi:hypothetical protein